MTGVSFLAAVILAPLVGANTDESYTLHRVELEGLPLTAWATADHVQARCGAHVKIIHRDDELISWKHLRTRGTKYHRCPQCRAKAATA